MPKFTHDTYQGMVDDRISKNLYPAAVNYSLMHAHFRAVSDASADLDTMKKHLCYHGKPMGAESKASTSMFTAAFNAVGDGGNGLFHSLLGVVTEAGEVAAALDTVMSDVARGVQGAALDVPNVKEELGDLLFYIQGAANALGITLQDLLDMNQAKLDVRLAKGFDAKEFLDRDLAAERAVLEGK